MKVSRTVWEELSVSKDANASMMWFVTSPNSYLGPAALLQSYRWVVDSNDSDFFIRINSLDLSYNISLCHAIGNCKIVCPKNLDPSGRIADMKSIFGFKSDKLYYYM